MSAGRIGTGFSDSDGVGIGVEVEVGVGTEVVLENLRLGSMM